MRINERDELASIVQHACAQTGMDWVYDHEALHVADAIIAAGYTREKGSR